ncbi:MAG: SMP-30/gluconolactonase/LRE family protein, partial [Planctomycetales bacterium]
MKNLWLSAALVNLSVILPSLAADHELIASGAKLQELGTGYKFTEGPAADSQGNVYFTDQPNDRIMVWSIDGSVREFMKPCGRSNGLFFDKQGHLWACADEKNQLWKISPDKKPTVVVEKIGGKLLNGPNDLWIHPHGAVYFTDPLYKRKYWTRGPQELPKAVYRLAPGAEAEPQRLDEDFKQPNGIVGTPDGKQLYVADIGDRK